MHWVNFIHIYQPVNQADDILDAVVNQSYRRVFKGLKNISDIKITLNISGALSELLEKKGYEDVLRDISDLAESERLEFAESAKYHVFLPLLPDDEIERQISLNRETNERIFGKSYSPTIFFPPEMAYDFNVARIVNKMGYKAILLDEIAWSGKVDEIPRDKIPTIKNAGSLSAIFRDRRFSNLIIGAIARNPDTLLSELGVNENENGYFMTGMDGETFGHHRPGLEELLFGVLASGKIPQVFASEVASMFPSNEEMEPLPSTWAASEYDIEQGIQFHSWKDEDNEIHIKQWELFDLALSTIRSATDDPGYSTAREKLDIGLASDQFFWASNRPWWSIEMIEQGAWLLIDALGDLSENYKEQQRRARSLYDEITALGFKWQREGIIRKESHEGKENLKIPFKERTLESGKPEVYNAFIELMKKAEKNASVNGEYEEAILWRDAIWKLETKNDIYDAIHVTDLLRNKLPLGEVENLMDKYKEKYRKIRGGQAEDRIKEI